LAGDFSKTDAFQKQLAEIFFNTCETAVQKCRIGLILCKRKRKKKEIELASFRSQNK
jgi:hypothetical protein